jgi:hypothetical protein
MIFGAPNAAKYLGISERTVFRLIKEALKRDIWDKEVFPKPSMEVERGCQTLRFWEERDLDTFRPHIRKRGRQPQNS